MIKNILSFFRPERLDKKDLFFGLTHANSFTTWLNNGDFTQFEEAYQRASWDARSILADAIALSDDYADKIEHWVTLRPASAIAQLFAGICYTGQAWQARSGKLARQISQKGARAFLDLLEKAADHLEKAIGINPNDAETYARMIRVCMGLNVDEQVTNNYFIAGKHVCKNHLHLHLMMINYLTPKWHGSVDVMHAFAQDHATADSRILTVLPLFACVEEWLYLGIENKQSERQQYFKNAERKQHLLTLFRNFQPNAEGVLLMPYVHNYFAFILHQMGEKNLAKKEIGKIGTNMTEYPWSYIGIESYASLQRL